MQAEEHRIAMMICTLRKVDDAEDWQAYHGIRRRVLFEERGRFGVYDNNHPDEFRAGNTPFLLIVADRPIGTVRVDLRNRPDAIVRMVAISTEERGKGRGRCLMELVAEFALSSGRTRLVLNAAPEAVGFYRKLGFNDEVWDDEELKGVLAGGPQMTKKIGVRTAYRHGACVVAGLGARLVKEPNHAENTR